MLTLTLARSGGGGDATPMNFSLGVICATFGKTFGSGQVRSLSYDIIRGTASDQLFKEIVFSAMALAAIDWNRDIMHGLGQNMTRSNLPHHDLGLSKVIRGH